MPLSLRDALECTIAQLELTANCIREATDSAAWLDVACGCSKQALVGREALRSLPPSADGCYGVLNSLRVAHNFDQLCLPTGIVDRMNEVLAEAEAAAHYDNVMNIRNQARQESLHA